MIAFYLLIIIFFSFLLIKATDVLVLNLQSLAKRTRVGKFVITSLLLALATSFPELFVGVTAALEKRPSLSLGNIIGSNIANISLVIGGAALIGGTVTVRGRALRRDAVYAFLAGIAPMLFLLDNQLSRVDGLILLALYGLFNTWVFIERRRKKPVVFEEEGGFVFRIIRRINHKGARRDFGWIFVGIVLLLVSADMIVRFGVKIAQFFNIPLLLVGLFLVAVGTSLPELAFSLEAIRKHQSEMVFGDLLGSIVANATLVIGITALISPINIRAFDEYFLATVSYILLFGAFYFFIHTKRRLERWEGAFLVGFYLAFLLGEFIHF